MAQPFVPGPCLLYIASYKVAGFGNQVPQEGAARFLGTCEVSPKVIERPHLQPWFNSLRGKLPADHIFHGNDALVVADVNRPDMTTVATIRPSGMVPATNVGTMMVHERQTHILYLYFPYALKPQYSGLPEGFRYLFAQMMGPVEWDNLGPEPLKIRFVWYANAWLNTNVKPNRWECYDNNVLAVRNLGFT